MTDEKNQELEILTYPDLVRSNISRWQKKGCDVRLKLSEEIYASRKNLDNYKQRISIDKATLLLETNWDKINDERKAQGLQKISNESMRKAYIDSQLVQETLTLNTLTNEHEYLLRTYEIFKGE